MGTLTVDIGQLVGGDLDERLSGAAFELTGRPAATVSPGKSGGVLVGGIIDREGFLAADGTATLPDVPATADDGVLMFTLPDIGATWQFQMPGDGATHALADLVKKFGPVNPVGPVPGPRGIYSVAVYLDQDDSEAAPETPTGGEIVTGTGTTTAPAGWVLRPGALADGKARWASSVTVVDGVDPPVITEPDWSAPIEVGDSGGGPTPGPATVHTELPNVGDGTKADPVTTGEGKILGKHIAEATIAASKLTFALGDPLYIASTEPAGAVDGAVWLRPTTSTKNVSVRQRVKGTFVEVAVATSVVANPSGSATGGALTKLTIGDTVFSIAEGHITAVKTKLPVTGDGTDDDPVTFDATLFATAAALAAEAKSRADGDTTLGGFITDEAADRAAADTALGGRITTEVSAREAGDDTLDGKITAETSAREAADTALGKRVDAETEARKTEDGKLAGRIDAADVKIAANTAKIPGPSNTAPGNTPGSPSAGTGSDYARHDHDHGIEAGGTAFTPTQANLFDAVDAMVEVAGDITVTSDADAHTFTIGNRREIADADWSTFSDGFTFRIGNIVPRNKAWFICTAPVAKGGVGPDNDPDHWDILDNWRGSWAAGYFAPGSRTFRNGVIYTATSAVVQDDPAPDADGNTKWLADGGVTGAGGGGVGIYAVLHDGEVDRTGTTFTISDLRENEVLDLTMRGADATARVVLPDGFIDLATGSAITNINIAASGANATMQRSVVWTKTGTSATATVQARTSTNATVVVAIVRPEHAAAFTPTPANLFQAESLIHRDGTDGVTYERDVTHSTLTPKLTVTQQNAYAALKAAIVAGDNVAVTPQDSKQLIVVSADEPDPAAPRLYAIDSRDLRNVQPPYATDRISTGFVLTSGAGEHRLHEAYSTHNYDPTRPGYVVDDTNGRRNSNGIWFGNNNAGTTVRANPVSLEITPANERGYGSHETLTVNVYVWGYLKDGNHADGYKQYTRTFHFVGGYQDPWTWEIPFFYSNNPRAGEHDSYAIGFSHDSGSSEVTGLTIDAVKETAYLPALGSVPTQDFTAGTPTPVNVQVTTAKTRRRWLRLFGLRQQVGAIAAELIPAAIAGQITSDSVALTWAVKAPNTTGKNAPDESDKSDVTLEGSNALMRAAQDLSRLKIEAKSTTAPTGSGKDIYLCAKAAGLPAQVLATTKTGSGWSIDWTGIALGSQDYYVIVPAGGTAASLGTPVASWNANPSDNRINNVVDGIIHTSPLQAGINFQPVTASVVTIQDAALVEAARAGLMHVVRLISGGVASETPLRGITRPLPEGSANIQRAVGPMRVRNSKNGDAADIVYAAMWWDMTGGKPSLHIRLTPTSNPLGASQSAYLEGVEVEYLVYDR